MAPGAAFPPRLLAALTRALKGTVPDDCARAVPLLEANVRKVLEARRLREDKERARPRRRAAVLLPLCTDGGVPSVLFTKRTELVSTHKGQVSFPGGHIEPGETHRACAVREMFEEVGIDKACAEVLGYCETVPAVTGTLVTPVVAVLQPDLAELRPFTLSDGEVDEVFSLPLAGIVSGELLEMRPYETKKHQVRTKSGALPVFHGGPHEVWGLTAMILHGFIENCLRPQLQEGDLAGVSGLGGEGTLEST
uniref:Nudix hydrolase domain-containing protein n=1 Tax=Phaeomonas parva TaxID=124430 RepID=A0A7S1XRQ8_9STRA|mmetsp:Transcript_32847/g.104000  ORF Transcript_32847/g.104000 Transcript_32847/m.104000 type:complete len:251 (+) Transcript_32847:476-1228(+)|eukprot:CAMPEP_0118882346 /NCGR_PEP_ID=MMETSP1163-20130328/21623_1 /TAXON_ID=124430 /ORGANISM="Phaeomonas parva, Strain CCMP2877" /LENGTH=250 /DNA_ID=CAMNT_0006819379 /DNA_START=371 /DNA_END=1123 /DNA_ORIENTATION=+